MSTLNVSVSAEPYAACPFCLTEIDSEPVPFVDESQTAKKSGFSRENSASNPPPTCTKGFGYLSKRGAKEQVPDDCLTCTAIVECMLKTS